MFDRLKRFFSSEIKTDESRAKADVHLTSDLPREAAGRSSTDSYFSTMSQMQEAISKHEFERAAVLVRANVQQLPEFVNGWRRQYGKFDIQSIPGLDQGGTILALTGDDKGLSEMQEIVASLPDLKRWTEEVIRHTRDRQLFTAIVEAVAAHRNCLQTAVKDFIGEQDGRRIANLISYLEKAGRIVRIKDGRTYRLALPSSEDAPPPRPTPVIVGSHRSDRNPPPLYEIDVSTLQYVPLPRSPLRWEETEQKRAQFQPSGELFEIRDAAEWRIASINKVPKAERPDPAFREIYTTSAGLFMIDDLGKAEGLGSVEAAALRYDRLGQPAAKSPLAHDIYRINVHPLGRGLIAMSSECVVHAYGEDLEPLFQTTLADSPEIVALKGRLGIPNDKLRNHIRCVALSRDATRYLFTAVDEAWCIDSSGKGLWGARMPMKEGWTRIATPSSATATSEQVTSALRVMNMSLPITPDDVKRTYRQLAKQWHPDVNPNSPEAEEKMKAVNAAMEVLTGVDMRSLPWYAGPTFAREIERTEVRAHGITFTVTLSQQGNETMAADWIYAASFAGNSDSVYLAGYSGRVALVDGNGKAVRVYDIGTVPRRIVDTGDYLYLLTDTRLYVLRGEALHAIVDTFDSGDFIVAQTGFGLLEKTHVRWFSQDGTYLGSVLTKDPIRRVYSSPAGMVVETRQHRAVVDGVPHWWE